MSFASRALAAVACLLALAGCTTETKDNFDNPPAGPPTSCAPVAAVAGCMAGALSYSCTSNRPDDGDSNLVCDEGTPGVSSTTYCCAPYGQWATECAPATVPGCGAESIGFACSGETSPDQADTSLVCSAALTADGGVHDYCCVPFDASAAVCRCASFDETTGMCGVVDAGCGSASIGFTCSGTHTPVEVNVALACGVPDGGGAGGYCCDTP